MRYSDIEESCKKVPLLFELFEKSIFFVYNKEQRKINTDSICFPSYYEKEGLYNIYEDFIFFLQTKEYELGTLLEKHHILPKHTLGKDHPDLNLRENLIKISISDHMTAHRYRFMAYGNKKDLTAFLFRVLDNDERSKQRAKLALAARKAKGLLEIFKDPAEQAKKGRIGGKIAGSLNTPAQQQQRSNLGRLYGRSTGLNNQGPELKKITAFSIRWYHQSGVNAVTEPCEGGVDIINQLEKVIPGAIKKQASFYRVLNGSRRRSYGWELKEKVIRSEVEDGIK